MYAISGILTVPAAPAPIPEPSTLVLLVCGVLGLIGLSRYQQRRKKGKTAV
jgi:predicted transporter